jgi:hypothetical protein
MLLRNAPDPLSFIEPCAPVLYDVAPAGPDWIHKIKHDGGDCVRLWSRSGRDWTPDFPAIAAAVGHAPEGLPDASPSDRLWGAVGPFSTPSTS